MYVYDEQKEMYIFDGDFEKFLIDIGVEKKHILKMKNKILQFDRGCYQDLSKTDSKERDYVCLVPLSKVVGTSRGTIGWSVYDNVRMMRKGEREPTRFKSCFDYLDKMSLDELKESYQNLSYPVNMVYCVDDDEYYLINDGNHRTLTAMLIGADKIKASVTNQHCDLLKKRKFESGKAFEEKYSIVQILCSENCYDIKFQDENGIYEIQGYEGKNKDEDMFSFLRRLSSTIDSDIAKAKFIKIIPKFIRKICFKNKNLRLESYIEKHYLSNDMEYYMDDDKDVLRWESL